LSLSSARDMLETRVLILWASLVVMIRVSVV
jgi:hypothetical protein